MRNGFMVYVYEVTVNGVTTKHEIPNKLNYAKTIANYKAELGQDTKVWIKMIDSYYWS